MNHPFSGIHIAFPSWLITLTFSCMGPAVSHAQTVTSITHSDVYDFNGSQINLFANPDFEQVPAGYSNQAWYAVVNSSSGCGYGTIPSWTTGPAGYESYATLTLLRPAGANYIFNDAFPALGGSGTCSGPTYAVTPDDVMLNSPLVCATDAATNWMMYFGNWEDVKKITGSPPAVNLVTGEVVPINTALSFTANGAGGTSNNTFKSLSSVSQTINSLTACHTYELEFFVSGEGFFGNNNAGSAAFYPADGILELTIGTQVLHLMSPGTGNFHGLGSSEIYHVQFVSPGTSLQIQVASPGHLLAGVPAPWNTYVTAPAGAMGVIAGNKYRSTESLIDGFRLFEVSSGVCAVLATELLSFGAIKTADIVKLSWEAVAGQPLLYYEIQRSKNGRDWDSIGQVEASIDRSGAKHDYGFTDPRYSAGANYYRLKILHSSGDATYSPVKLIDVSDGDASSIEARPNPVTDRLTVMGRPGAYLERVGLLDTQGRLLFTRALFPSGSSIDMSGYPSGVYLLRIESREGASIRRIVKR